MWVWLIPQMELFDQLVGADDLQHSTYWEMWQLN
jgi:hypothetical protein